LFLCAPAKFRPSSGEVVPGAAVYRRVPACRAPGPPDPRSTNQITYPFVFVTGAPCTSGPSPQHRSTAASAAAPSRADDASRRIRSRWRGSAPALGHQSCRRPPARTPRPPPDPDLGAQIRPGHGSTDPIPVNRGRFTKRTPPFLISHICPSTFKYLFS
jgi:hypothetical protein